MQATSSIIKLLLSDFHQTILPSLKGNIVRRDLSLGTKPKPKIGSTARVVVGMRRSGKTFRLYQEILDLIELGADPRRICYFNFDDDRLRPYSRNLVGEVLETFFEMQPSARSEGAYVFFDEIQEVPSWDVAVRRILDTEKVSLYVTGSSSRMLSEDVATEFRGRSIAYELLPYSFREYLRAQGFEAEPAAIAGNKETASFCKNRLLAYLSEGGFPAAQNLDPTERVQLLQSYSQFTVARDVVERFGFSNAAYARSLATTAITSSARDVSISRLDAKGKSGGYTPGRLKITELLDAFEDAHLVYQLYDFSYSAQKIRLGGMKLYAADPGLYWATSIASDDQLTFSLETAVYLELRRRRRTGRLGSIAMLKLPSGKEVDFIEGDASIDAAAALVQVCFDMANEKTRKREVEALVEAMERFDCKEGTIVTLDEEEDIAIADGMIRVIPAWKWLLQE